MNEIGIIFQYHEDNPICRQNYHSFKKQNPDIPLITIKRAVNNRAWYDTDVGMYYWYMEKNVDCKRWVYFDWDTYCDMPVKEFYSSVWNEQLVGAQLRKRRDGWVWFSKMNSLPFYLREIASGIVPLSGLFMDDITLALLTKEYFCSDFPEFKKSGKIFCELRVPIMAKLNNIRITQHPFAINSIRYEPFLKIPLNTICHPVKSVINPELSKMEGIIPDYEYSF